MEINGRYFLDDPETGGMYEVTKERYDQYHQTWEQFIESFKSMVDVAKERKGTIIITSTVADDNSNDDFKNIWNQK